MEGLYGFFLGLVVAAIAAYKDTLFEDFEPVKFFRTPIVTELWYLALRNYYPDQPLSLVLLSSAALERLTVESYKAVRRQPPGKFQSPLRDWGWLRRRLGQGL